MLGGGSGPWVEDGEVGGLWEEVGGGGSKREEEGPERKLMAWIKLLSLPVS